MANVRSVMTRGLVTATIALGICASASADSPGTFSGWQQGMCLPGWGSTPFRETLTKDACLAACAARDDAQGCSFVEPSRVIPRGAPNCAVSHLSNVQPHDCRVGNSGESDEDHADHWAGVFARAAHARPQQAIPTTRTTPPQHGADAHEKALEDSFGPRRPVSTATAASRNACLRGDDDACRALHPAEQPPKDSETECREQLQPFLERCQRQTSECQQKCSERRWACWKAACDAACAGNPTSVKCMLCACPQQIDCDCNFCQSVPRCSQRPEGQTQVR